MADTSLTTLLDAQNKESVIGYPTDYYLDYIVLLSSTSKTPINLKPFMLELNYFEDIFSSTISGQVVISDALSLMSTFKLNGTEFIEFQLKKTKADPSPIKRIFRVFKVSNQATSVGINYATFVLNFCSEEFLLSEQYRISKSFKSTKISSMITKILNDYLKVGKVAGTKKCYIEETYGDYSFVLPNKKIFETINWLSTYARPLPAVGGGADMLFFENGNGYWFHSLQTLYKQNKFDTFYYDPKNTSIEMSQKTKNIIDFQVMDMFDTLGAASNGTFRNRLISLDIMQRKKTVTDFNYDTYYKKSQKLNPAPLTNNYKNRMGDMQFDAPAADKETGALRMAVGNSNQSKNSWLKNTPNALGKDIFIETFVPNRVAQMGLANYVKLKITVPGHTQMAAGVTIDLNVFNITAAFDSQNPEGGGAGRREYDSFYSGKYLVSAVRHIVKNDSYITVMEIIKDSHTLKGQLSGIDSNDPMWQTAINGVQP